MSSDKGKRRPVYENEGYEDTNVDNQPHLSCQSGGSSSRTGTFTKSRKRYINYEKDPNGSDTSRDVESEPHQHDERRNESSSFNQKTNAPSQYVESDLSSKCVLIVIFMTACLAVFSIGMNLANPIFIVNKMDEMISDEVRDQSNQFASDTSLCIEDWLPYRNTCYLKTAEGGSKNFSSAVSICNQKDGFLAFPRSINEYIVLNTLAAPSLLNSAEKFFWFGATRQDLSWIGAMNQQVINAVLAPFWALDSNGDDSTVSFCLAYQNGALYAKACALNDTGLVICARDV